MPSLKRKWPVDLIGGSQRGAGDPELRRAILDTEIGFIPAVSTVVGIPLSPRPVCHREDGPKSSQLGLHPHSPLSP
jgi:hypothetical protein